MSGGISEECETHQENSSPSESHLGQLGAGSVFICMEFPLGRVMSRGGVRRRFWENVMGLAELFGVWVHDPTPPGSCMVNSVHAG